MGVSKSGRSTDKRGGPHSAGRLERQVRFFRLNGNVDLTNQHGDLKSECRSSAGTLKNNRACVVYVWSKF